METIGSPGRLVGALAAPGKSLDKGAARGKSAPPAPPPPPPPWVPPYFHRSPPPHVFLDASLLPCLGQVVRAGCPKSGSFLEKDLGTTPTPPKAQKPKTFRIAAFQAQFFFQMKRANICFATLKKRINVSCDIKNTY